MQITCDVHVSMNGYFDAHHYCVLSYFIVASETSHRDQRGDGGLYTLFL